MNHDSTSFRLRLLINRPQRIGLATNHARLDQQFPLGRQDWTYWRLIGYWVAVFFKTFKTLGRLTHYAIEPNFYLNIKAGWCPQHDLR